jgi:GxxExxY protein
MEMEEILNQVIDAAGEVYRILGAGYQESIYEEAMAVEFRKRKLKYEVERTTEVFYKGEKVGEHRLDFIVEGKLVVELKAATSISKSHIAQMNSYLKTLKKEKGLLINFPYPEKEEPETRIVAIE